MKNLKKLGKVLSSKEQKEVNGGTGKKYCGKCGAVVPGAKECFYGHEVWLVPCFQ